MVNEIDHSELLDAPWMVVPTKGGPHYKGR